MQISRVMSVIHAVCMPSREWKYMTGVQGKEICAEDMNFELSPREDFLQEDGTEWEEEWKENSGAIKIDTEGKTTTN